MPELPDIAVYVEAIQARVLGQPLQKIRVASPFLVRTAVPPLREVEGRRVDAVRRLGKRIVFVLGDELFLALHLMIAGRLHWKEAGAKVPGRVGLAAFDFPNGTLTLTEASTKKRAALHVLRDLSPLMRSGIEPLEATVEQFAAVIRAESHTLKRTLTDPDLFSGIGNAYSDEILHRAGLSPMLLTRKMTDEEIERLHAATAHVLTEWIERLRDEAKGDFPEKVSAFRQGFATHGQYGKPCPVCGTAIQRIVYAENEANYCPTCQTGGRLLADRSLSRLLKDDWPRTLDELEQRRAATRS